MKIKIFCCCSLFPSWSGWLISTPVHTQDSRTGGPQISLHLAATTNITHCHESHRDRLPVASHWYEVKRRDTSLRRKLLTPTVHTLAGIAPKSVRLKKSLAINHKKQSKLNATFMCILALCLESLILSVNKDPYFIPFNIHSAEYQMVLQNIENTKLAETLHKKLESHD